MEEVKIDIIKPVTIKVQLSGRARNKDNKFSVRWFDGTIKTMAVPDFVYHSTDFMQALREVTALYQLNSESILSISLKTI